MLRAYITWKLIRILIPLTAALAVFAWLLLPSRQAAPFGPVQQAVHHADRAIQPTLHSLRQGIERALQGKTP